MLFQDVMMFLTFYEFVKNYISLISDNNLSNCSTSTTGDVTKEIPVSVFNVTEVNSAFSASGKSIVKTRSCSPNTAYIDITFPPFFSIILTAFLVRSDETFLSASVEYFPNIINIGILQSLLNVGILQFYTKGDGIIAAFFFSPFSFPALPVSSLLLFSVVFSSRIFVHHGTLPYRFPPRAFICSYCTLFPSHR